MKKFKCCLWGTVTALSILTSASACSDTLLGIYGGMGMWDVSLDGSMGVDEIPVTTNELGIDSDSSNFFYVAFEHPIPLLPNVRLQHLTLKSTGNAVVNRNFTFNDMTFPANAATFTNLELTQTDITLYYEVLDNWISLDLGLTAKVLDGFGRVLAEPEGLDVIEEETSVEGALPMLYGMVRFDLPLTGFYAGGHLNYISYDNNSVSDIDVKVGWMFDSILDFGAELGYRQFSMELNDFDDANADLTYDGPYLNLAVHF